MKHQIPDSGNVEIYTGVMGAGKSLLAVDRILDIIQIEKRPVFTNLPIKHAVIRKYLRIKSGPEFASLIYPLAKDHFQRFIERQHLRMEMRETMHARSVEQSKSMSMVRLNLDFEREHGVDLYRGAQANSIHPCSYVIIDEAHHWYGIEDGKDADAELRRYLTMCRHHMHNVILITQHPMQMVVCTRRLTTKFTICSRMDHVKLAGSLTFKNLGVPVLVRRTYSSNDIYNGELRTDAEHLDSKILYLRSARVRVLFRLYSSFLHIGSPRAMLRKADDVRRTHGIYEVVERLAQEAREAKKGRFVRMIKSFMKMGFRLSFAVLFLIAGYSIGANFASPLLDDDVVQDFTLPDDLRVRGYAAGRVRIGEDWYAKGDDFYGSQVLRVARDGLLCLFDGRLYGFGQTGIADFGPADSVISRFGGG